MISQALSLHGTDVGEEFAGEIVQARVLSFPAVVVGALPEGLIDEVGAAHRLPGPDSYKVKEANLLVLCGVSLDGAMTNEGLVCTFNLSKLSVPNEVEMPVRVVLKLAIQAVKETLERYYREAQDSQKVMIKISGTNEKNATLKDLSMEFKVGK